MGFILFKRPCLILAKTELLFVLFRHIDQGEVAFFSNDKHHQ